MTERFSLHYPMEILIEARPGVFLPQVGGLKNRKEGSEYGCRTKRLLFKELHFNNNAAWVLAATCGCSIRLYNGQFNAEEMAYVAFSASCCLRTLILFRSPIIVRILPQREPKHTTEKISDNCYYEATIQIINHKRNMSEANNRTLQGFQEWRE